LAIWLNGRSAISSGVASAPGVDIFA
jgi:hypothetical protein